MKNSIKRAQSQARLSFAERKNFRLQAKHKILLTLVALFAMTTGAWAQTGENIFQYCYDCQRNPAYPTAMTSASLSGFQNPLVGYKGSGFGMDNTSDGPWKMEYMGIWSTTDKHEIDDVSYYQSTYNCTDVPVFRLYQWNATANEYQHAAYGVVCCYAKVSNAVEHTALFVSQDGWGCVLTNSSHSSSMNITFDEDLTTGLTTLIASATPAAAGPEVTWNAATKTGTFAMPGYDVELEVAYFNITAPTANTTDGDIHAGTTTPLINAGSTTEEGATIKYLVTATNEQPTSTDGFSADVPTAEAITAPGTYYVWYYLDFATGDDSDISAQAIQVTVADYLNYTISLAKGTEDAGKWDIVPTEAKLGTEIKATYTGTKRVKSVKAVKKPEPKLDLATVTADTTVEDGYTVTGTLGANVKISIADGATVTLDGVTISNGQIACSGNATIVLMGTNAVTGANAAIKIGGSGTTLTITGSGSLTAQGGWGSAGIGTDSNGSGGNIVINGGTVTATGGMYGAGIGTGNAQGSNNTCGDITINGGRVTAQGGSNAAGIGTGISSMSMSATSDSNNTCGAITIGTGVTMVTATKGSSAPNSIGKGKGGMGANQACGTITIGGDATTYAAGVTTSPFTYPTAP